MKQNGLLKQSHGDGPCTKTPLLERLFVQLVFLHKKSVWEAGFLVGLRAMKKLLSWNVLSVFLPSLVGLGFGVLALGDLDDFIIAKACFLIVCLVLGVKIVLWGAERRRSMMSYLLVFIGCGALGVIALVSVQYVNRKRDLKFTSTSSETTKPQTPALESATQVKIFLSDKHYLEMTEIKFKDPDELAEIFKDRIGQGNRPLLHIAPGQELAHTNIIIRNTSKEKIRNAHVSITSTSPIEALTSGAKPFSPNQISWDVPVIAPYSNLGEENFFTVQFPAANPTNSMYFLITVYADNLEPYAATGGFKFVVVFK